MRWLLYACLSLALAALSSETGAGVGPAGDAPEVDDLAVW